MADIAIPKITAVMTLRDKPENLILQLDSLMNQTLPVSEIILFQDRLDNGVYTVKLANEIKERFHNVFVSETATGAEGLLDFVRREAKGDYVCILDDDALVGNRWIEVNYFHMLLKEGVYSTYNGNPQDGGLALINDWPTLNLGDKEREEAVSHNSWFMRKDNL